MLYRGAYRAVSRQWSNTKIKLSRISPTKKVIYKPPTDWCKVRCNYWSPLAESGLPSKGFLNQGLSLDITLDYIHSMQRFDVGRKNTHSLIKMSIINNIIGRREDINVLVVATTVVIIARFVVTMWTEISYAFNLISLWHSVHKKTQAL